MDTKALDALFPGARRRILAALFGEPDRWWSVAELAGRAGLHPGTLRQHVSPLRDGGILRQKTADGHTLVQPDPASPIFGELRAIVLKLTNAANCAETILVVEDQPATAQITRILLESWGYHVVETHSGEEALEAFAQQDGAIHLLLSDVNLPRTSGPVLAQELQARKPDLRVIFMSGYHNDELTRGGMAFLPKPFNPASLARIVRKELDRRDPAHHRMNSSLD